MNISPLREGSSPTVSVVIPARNAASTLPSQLTAVVAQKCSVQFEVIVVDSASDDDTADVSRRFSGVRVIHATRPGANRARNLGIESADGEIILLCDADDIVHPGWIEALYLASRQADYFGGQLELAELNSDRCRELWGITEPLRTVESKVPHVAPMSCNCGFRRDMWMAVGGFDEDLSVANDEYEFFWRAGHSGFTYLRAPDALVSYRLRAGGRSILARELRAGRADVRAFIAAREIGHPRQTVPRVLYVYAWVGKEALLGMTRRRRRWAAFRIGARRLGRALEAVASRTLYL